MQTRRQFLAQATTASLLGWRGVGAQTPRSILVPGLEVGELTTSFALRNVTVIDGTGRPNQPGMVVVIANNRIQSMGPVASVALNPNVTVVDAGGKFLIPGLWDMHAHSWPGVGSLGNPLQLGMGVDLTSQFAVCIGNGVTGIRTMGGDRWIVQQFAKLRSEITEGKRLGPRLAVASQTLSRQAAPDATQGRSAVRTAIADGAEFIKVHNGLSRDTYFAIVDEAKKLKLTVVGHAPGPDLLIDECAKAGQKSFEHMQGVLYYLNTHSWPHRVDDLTLSQKETLYDIFRKNNAWLCPTLAVMYSFGVDPRVTADPRLKYIASGTKASWAARAAAVPLDSNGSGRQWYQEALGHVGAMHRAGVNILAGTDATPSVTFGGLPLLPGFGLHDELRHLVFAGLSPLDALRTATYKPAEYLGLLDSLGTVEPDKLAEMVLLDGNPLDDINNTTKIQMVFTGGRVYRRAALDAILSAVEANARN
jgi:imidazolonepropionase-like amidohydrolase